MRLGVVEKTHFQFLAISKSFFPKNTRKTKNITRYIGHIPIYPTKINPYPHHIGKKLRFKPTSGS